MGQISKDMTFGQLLEQYYEKCPKIVEVLMEAGICRVNFITLTIGRGI